jgi:hypothetical protein
MWRQTTRVPGFVILAVWCSHACFAQSQVFAPRATPVIVAPIALPAGVGPIAGPVAPAPVIPRPAPTIPQAPSFSPVAPQPTPAPIWGGDSSRIVPQSPPPSRPDQLWVPPQPPKSGPPIQIAPDRPGGGITGGGGTWGGEKEPKAIPHGPLSWMNDVPWWAWVLIVLVVLSILRGSRE